MQHIREAGQGAVRFEHVADGDNALGGVGASALAVEPAELVAVQPETRGLSKKQALSAGPDTFALVVQAVQRALKARQGAIQLEHGADRDNALRGVGALASVVEPAELIVAQPERR